MSEDPARVGRTIFVANAHRDPNGRFIVRADERLTAFMELESAIRALCLSRGFSRATDLRC